jgi:hypothetical protein
VRLIHRLAVEVVAVAVDGAVAREWPSSPAAALPPVPSVDELPDGAVEVAPRPSEEAEVPPAAAFPPDPTTPLALPGATLAAPVPTVDAAAPGPAALPPAAPELLFAASPPAVDPARRAAARIVT